MSAEDISFLNFELNQSFCNYPGAVTGETSILLLIIMDPQDQNPDEYRAGVPFRHNTRMGPGRHSGETDPDRQALSGPIFAAGS